MLYMNDLESPGKIYKYNLDLSQISDTIFVNGVVKDISFHE